MHIDSQFLFDNIGFTLWLMEMLTHFICALKWEWYLSSSHRCAKHLKFQDLKKSKNRMLNTAWIENELNAQSLAFYSLLQQRADKPVDQETNFESESSKRQTFDQSKISFRSCSSICGWFSLNQLPGPGFKDHLCIRHARKLRGSSWNSFGHF